MDTLSNRPFIFTTANIATVLFALVILFQILLAAGVVPVSMTWGGRQAELTPSLRISSILAVVLLGVFIFIIRYRAGQFGAIPAPLLIKVLSWVITAFMALNTLGNLSSASAAEKWIFTPITILLTLACLVISLSKIEVRT